MLGKAAPGGLDGGDHYEPESTMATAFEEATLEDPATALAQARELAEQAKPPARDVRPRQHPAFTKHPAR